MLCRKEPKKKQTSCFQHPKLYPKGCCHSLTHEQRFFLYLILVSCVSHSLFGLKKKLGLSARFRNEDQVHRKKTRRRKECRKGKKKGKKVRKVYRLFRNCGEIHSLAPLHYEVSFLRVVSFPLRLLNVALIRPFQCPTLPLVSLLLLLLTFF